MTPSACLVVTTTATERGEVLAAAVRGLCDAGWDARVLCKGEAWADDPALHVPALDGLVELTAETGPYQLPPALRRHPGDLARYLRASGETGPFDQRLLELRPDLVHFHSGWSGWKGMRLRDILGCRVVVSLRADGQDLEVPDLSLLWSANLFLFPDAEALERAAARGCPLERAEVLPPPVSLAGNGRKAESEALRVVSAAPVTWEQGLEHSVHAVRLVLDRGVDCEYRIVGEGDHMLAVAFARHQLGLTERVELVGHDGGDPVRDALASADVFVDPAVADVSSGALELAHASGVPFVATRREGLPADAGITVPPRDPTAIADAIATLAGDPELRRRMGEAALARTGPYPTVDAHVKRLEDLYARVLREP